MPRNRQPDRGRVMTRITLARELVGLLVIAGLAQEKATAQDQPPPLEPPALVAPRTTKPAAGSPASTPARPSENRPLLVIPGVTAPLPTRPSVRLAPPGVSASEPKPATSNPRRMQDSTKPTRTVQSLARPATSPPGSIPLTLEAIPDDPPPELGSERPSRSVSPRALSGSTPAQNNPRPTTPRNTSSILGRLLAPSNLNEDIAPGRGETPAEPRSDPAAEAALKRRIQKQVEKTLGDHIRSVEVRLNGRTVVFRARASRFWYRRSVRRTLEGMSLPAGYRARVEAVE